MRILHVSSHLNIGGVSRYVISVSRALSSRGHVIKIASGGGDLEEQAHRDGLEHWKLPLHTKAEWGLQVFLAGRRLIERLRRNPVDIIHAHSRVAQVVADRVSHRLKIPYVTTWHGFFRPNIGRRLWPCAGDLTIAISEPVRRHLEEVFRVSSDRIRLIQNGADVSYFSIRPTARAVNEYRLRYSIPEQGPIIGCVSRLASGRVKGIDLLLSVTEKLRERFAGLQLLIVGDGPRRAHLENEAMRFGIRDRVHFVGASLDTRLPLALMDIFVFSSRDQEGFGLSLIEAMCANRPVVATQVGAVADIIEDGLNGLIVPPDDVSSLADGISRLLNDPAMAAKLGSNAHERVKKRFSLEMTVDKIEDVYRELVGAVPA